ncbi:DUF2752 domain-containing protein [Pedobacter sp. UYEF25]
MIKYRFCSPVSFIVWLQNHLLPCPFKFITGINCPGCGFQRSIVALFEGNFSQSWFLYPATVPLMLLFLYAGYRTRFPVKNDRVFLKIFMLIVGNFIVVSYVYKILSQ